MTLHISYTRTDRLKRSVRYCPTCTCRRRMVDRFQEWYGWRSMCCACGESWEDGERLPRPFERGWRKRRADAAKKAWKGTA